MMMLMMCWAYAEKPSWQCFGIRVELPDQRSLFGVANTCRRIAATYIKDAFVYSFPAIHVVAEENFAEASLIMFVHCLIRTEYMCYHRDPFCIHTVLRQK